MNPADRGVEAAGQLSDAGQGIEAVHMTGVHLEKGAIPIDDDQEIAAGQMTDVDHENGYHQMNGARRRTGVSRMTGENREIEADRMSE
jgi:hypothetical protein